MKRILTVQDVSCVGKCSLTVALPIISAMGIEAAILPTATLSTHTAFSGFTFRDLTEDIAPICRHWKEQGIDFDGLYTGYLGSPEQIALVLDIFKQFGRDKLKFVDPAMGDNGKLYAGFDEAFALEMAKLCAVADVIVPNLTEACFMLGEPYVAQGYSEQYIRSMLKKLCALGCRHAVITGVELTPGKLGCYGYDSKTDTYFFDYNEKLPQSFHGTGDIFASVCFSCLTNGHSLKRACSVAADFVCDSIVATTSDENPIWYGVHFEKVLSSGKYLPSKI
ncbi:MAG: pyridoxamine kinase [Clostridia bacterium]|nr:pyridoxamine kinase [Clostridia bacterium]